MREEIFKKLNCRVTETKWSTRTRNGLSHSGVTRYIDIYTKQEERGGYNNKPGCKWGLLRARGFGVTSLREIESQLRILGLPELKEAPNTIEAYHETSAARRESIETALEKLLRSFGKKCDPSTIQQVLNIV